MLLADSIPQLKALKAIRTMRALRPLRALRRFPGMKLAVNCLLRSIPLMLPMALVCILFFIIFGILGLQFFAGKFWYCEFGEDLDAGASMTELKNFNSSTCSSVYEHVGASAADGGGWSGAVGACRQQAFRYEKFPVIKSTVDSLIANWDANAGSALYYNYFAQQPAPAPGRPRGRRRRCRSCPLLHSHRARRA